MKVVKRILCYLKGILDHDLDLSRATDLSFTTFYDFDWVGDTRDRKSTIAYLIYVGPNAISWSYKKQLTVAKYSTKAEYRTIVTTTTELLWLRELLKEFGHLIIKTP